MKIGHQKESLVKAKKDAVPIGAMLRFYLPINDKKQRIRRIQYQ